jgi:acyl carrier protein
LQFAGGMRDVLGSKVGGLSRLEAAGMSTAAGQPLGSLVLCSSVAALMGSVGQSSYSGGNAVLDAWSKRRAVTGAAGTSVQWGAWGGVGGMATAGGDRIATRIEAMGLGILAPEDGLNALSAIMHARPTSSSLTSPPLSLATVSPLNFHRIGLVVRPLPGILVDIPEALAGAEEAAERDEAAANPSSKSGGMKKMKKKGAGKKKGRSLESVLTSIRDIAQGLIGNSDMRDDEPLMDAGLDSLTGVELKTGIDSEFGIELAPTAAFDFPTVAALATHVHSEIGGGDGGGDNEAAEADDDNDGADVDDGCDYNESSAMALIAPGVGLFSSAAAPYRSPAAVLSHSCKAPGARGGGWGTADSITHVASSRWNVDNVCDQQDMVGLHDSRNRV